MKKGWIHPDFCFYVPKRFSMTTLKADSSDSFAEDNAASALFRLLISSGEQEETVDVDIDRATICKKK